MNASKSRQETSLTLREFIGIAKALSDKNRLRMLLALRGGELCLCQISELVGLAASTASKHMSILRGASLVRARKQGRWVYYRWPSQDNTPAVRQMLKSLEKWLAHDRQVIDDAQRLREILKTSPEALCDPGRTGTRGSRKNVSSTPSQNG